MANGDETPLSCSKCSAVWQKCGTTNCWSGNPDTAPPKPGNCPAERYDEIIADAAALFKGESEDARLARIAARVEGLCYQRVPGSDAINARWTRVEDTVALALLMGWKRIGIASIYVYETEQRLILGPGLELESICCKGDGLELGSRRRQGKAKPSSRPATRRLCGDINSIGTNEHHRRALCRP
jgi:hypothetical protein